MPQLLPNQFLIVVGHSVTVNMVFTATEKTMTTRGVKVSSKKIGNPRMENMVLPGMTRSEFIIAALQVHEVANQFSPGVHSGPSFKIWWTGSPYVTMHFDYASC